MLRWTERLLEDRPFTQEERELASMATTCLYGQAAKVLGLPYSVCLETIGPLPILGSCLAWARADMIFTARVCSDDRAGALELALAVEDRILEIKREGTIHG